MIKLKEPREQVLPGSMHLCVPYLARNIDTDKMLVVVAVPIGDSGVVYVFVNNNSEWTQSQGQDWLVAHYRIYKINLKTNFEEF